jgi:hypothetical protein
MSDAKSVAPQPRALTVDDMDWRDRRMAKLETKINLILAILVDKKLISEEVGKRLIMETATESKLDWLLKELKEKKN